MDNCITCSSLRCSSPDRKLRTKCATSYAVFCNCGQYFRRFLSLSSSPTPKKAFKTCIPMNIDGKKNRIERYTPLQK
ncbi:MAG: hypothetical protein AABX07_04030 [Nanoarchaeota archaeon]